MASNSGVHNKVWRVYWRAWIMWTLIIVFGKADSKARISVYPLDSAVEVNTKISFFCRVESTQKPIPGIMWKKNGKPVAQARYTTETLSNGLSTLRIEPVREKDNDSRLSCHLDPELTTEGTTGSSKNGSLGAKLLILKAEDLPLGFPQIQEDPKLRAVEKNHSATMTCAVKGQPTPRVLWLKDLTPVDMSNPRYSVATLGNPGSLVIQNSEETDEGKYECVARNEKGVVHSRSAHLYVKVRRVPPQFSIPPRRLYHVPPGGKVEMNCVAYGHPMPRVFWRRTRTNEDLERPETAPIGKNVLTLNNVLKTENYSCVAFSSLGNINAEVTVEVKALPDPPDQIKLFNVSARSVALNWSYSQSVSYEEEGGQRRYVVKYKPKYSDGGDYLDSEIRKEMNVVIDNLEPYTEYEFRVHTVVELGISKPSRPVEATTGETLPESPPKNVQSRPLSATNILVQWEPPEKPNGRILAYKVYYNNKETEPYTNWPFKEISEGRMAQINELQSDKLYTVKVQAKNSIGYGPSSDSVLVYTKTGIPGQPSNVKATTLSSNEILVTWNPPLHPDVRFYTLNYNTSTSGSTKSIQVPGSVNEKKFDSLKPNTEYSFQVTATSSRGEGAPSKRVQIKTGASVPNSAPDSVVVETLNSTSIRVIWEPPRKLTVSGQPHNSLITKYRVTVREKLSLSESDESKIALSFNPKVNDEEDQEEDNNNLDEKLTTKTALQNPFGTEEPARIFEQRADKQRSMVIGNLKSYTVYEVTLAAGTSMGYGPETSPPTEVRTQADGPATFEDDRNDDSYLEDLNEEARRLVKYGLPGPPREVQTQPLNETAVKLSWDEPLDRNGPVSGYFVDLDELNDDNQFLSQKPIRNFMITKEVIVNNLKSDTKYSARVSAYNSKGDGVASKAKTFRMPPLKPMAPRNVKIDLLPPSPDQNLKDPLKVLVKWEAPENFKHIAKTFMLKYRLKEEPNFQEVLVHNVTQHEIGDIKYGRAYEFKVSALYNGQYGEDGWNSIITPVGIPEGAPTGMRYKYSANDRSLLFTWDELSLELRNGEITRYQIVLEGGVSGAVTREVKEARASYQGISPTTKYKFKVRAGTIKDFGPWSNLTIVEPNSTDQFLVEILELTAMSETEGGVKWATLNHVKVQGYRVSYTREASVDSWQHQDVRNRSLDHAYIENLHPRATYQFCVQALIDDKKVSECASHRSLELKPVFVVKDLEYEMIEDKVARLTWTYDGPEPAKFEVYYDLKKTYLMNDGVIRNLSYTVPVDNVTDTQVDVPGLRFYTNYTFKISVIYNNKIYLPQRKFMVTGVEPPPEFEPPKVLEVGRKDVKLKLHAAADENGPVLLYWLVIAPSNYSKNFTENIDNVELQSENDNLHIAAEFGQSQLWAMPDQTIVIGDGTTYTGMFGGSYYNRPLNHSKRFKAFLRAFVGPPGGKNDKNYKSSSWSVDFGLVAPPMIAGGVYNSNLWIFAPLIILLVFGVIIGGVWLFMVDSKRKRRLNAKRASVAKMSLSGLNGGPNETSKLLMVHDFNNGPIMPPPINGNVKPYETSASSVLGGNVYGSYGDQTDLARRRNSSHYPTPPMGPVVTSGHYGPVSILDFGSHVERLKADDNLLFSREYESIETDQHFTWEHSNKEINKPKNRYANVIAYDHSRVVLSTLDNGPPYSDYINANYIDGYHKSKVYIATQGPLLETFGDFWRMIWEQNSSSIVMLTKLEERTRVKCDQYWPTSSRPGGGPPVLYGLVQVSAKETLEFAHYTLRIFEISKIGSQETREVKQMQFTAWPDHGVPDHPTPFLMFLRRVKALNPPDSGPILVHCSAGVGRTGAFVVIDIMLERLRFENTLDVYGCVCQVRSQRNYMVQTEEQYTFIHEALLDAVQSGCTEVPVNKLYAHIQKLMQINNNDQASSMEIEFRILSNLKFNHFCYTAANHPCNKSKNRLVNILPYDTTRVVLTPQSGQPEGADYINASFLDGYRRRRAYVATQGPLIHTVDDFWRLLWEQNSTIIVMLTKLKEMGREKCHQYWPSDRGERYGSFAVEPIAEYNMPQYILREFKLTDTRDGQSRTVRHFQYTEWPEQGVPKSGEYFIEFIGQVHKTKEQFGQEGPITVHCSAGVGRTGVFVCLSIVLERMRYEGVVDIFTTVKLLRTQRANMVQSEDQYHFCYRAALEYLGSFDHYALQSHE